MTYLLPNMDAWELARAVEIEAAGGDPLYASDLAATERQMIEAGVEDYEHAADIATGTWVEV